MSDAMPGTRLLRIAERLFDRTTLDRVIAPAIADLQHECLRAGSTRLRDRIIRMRAHWAVWKTLTVCLLVSSGRLGIPTARGVAARMAVIFTIVCGLLMIPPLDDKAIAYIGLTRHLLLSLPHAAAFALLVAYYFALVLEPETVPPRRLLPVVFTMSLACTVIMTAVTMSVVPRATTAYAESVAAQLRATRPPGQPVVRPTFGREQEWTFTEVVRKSIDGGSPVETALARRTLSKRLAVSTLPIMLGFVGLAISGYPMRIALFNGVWVLILYVAVGRAFAQSSTAGPTTESVWLINGLFTLAGFCLVFRRPGAIGSDRTRLPSPW